ncbi:hypothetical protein [Halococcus sp. IIIV-5B]|uniref:hypothetical protein n=1 Tax=Halococcus sp. IIIV-5B TaxID=2321230 RepID=UPI0011C3C2B7|nr:hypothetical protein [Halococcus sp. IIIV-5B]
MAGNAKAIDGGGDETVTVPATETQRSSGLDGNVVGALSSVLWLVTGITFCVVDDREFVRFHAAQSIVFSGVLVTRVV